MEANNERKLIHVRVTPDLHDRLTAYMERTHRSQTNAVVHLLELALRDEEAGD